MLAPLHCFQDYGFDFFVQDHFASVAGLKASVGACTGDLHAKVTSPKCRKKIMDAWSIFWTKR